MNIDPNVAFGPIDTSHPVQETDLLPGLQKLGTVSRFALLGLIIGKVEGSLPLSEGEKRNGAQLWAVKRTEGVEGLGQLVMAVRKEIPDVWDALLQIDFGA